MARRAGENKTGTRVEEGEKAQRRREPDEEEVLEEALKTAVAEMYRVWAETGSPSGG